MTTEQIFVKIQEWEDEAGESFVDYFMHDRVDDKDWGQFLIQKGFEDRGKAIIEVYDAHKEAKQFCCQDQDFLYSVNQEPDFDKETNWKGLVSYECLYDDEGTWSRPKYEQDVMLWAEFLSTHPIYLEKVKEFFKDSEDEDAD